MPLGFLRWELRYLYAHKSPAGNLRYFVYLKGGVEVDRQEHVLLCYKTALYCDISMTFTKAREEFAVRYYEWGTLEFKREMADSFPILRSFKSGRFWKLHRFMQQLGKYDQIIMASARLKHNNPEAIAALGEHITPKEEALLTQFREFCLDFPTRQTEEAEIRARVEAAGRTRFASKAKIRRAILKQFRGAFETECFDLAIVGIDPELDFKMKRNGWIVTTHFDFEVRGRQFDYGHAICSEASIPPHGMPAVILGFPSLTGWLGLRGDTGWEHLIDEDIQPVCDFIIQHCRIFFDVLPKLLKGLDFESLTPD
ncbi:hypothetical protein [Pedosphaera parvula]|uniref:Uncharacterized protein n=1 Tax=Pedosphaera parvula (strain Ellin514) TaxID=320771 RepID=B9XQG3_PEDPL|nr:hypothetical protein [Pedosphaera parvula]EEF57888.1 hypothetical protein Cflav_PD0838 [Pedosphaera parvula Ellin514]